MYEAALPALQTLLTWPAPLYLVFGTLLGMLFGILPGLGGPQVLALLLPITYGMPVNQGIVLMVGAMAAIAFGAPSRRFSSTPPERVRVPPPALTAFPWPSRAKRAPPSAPRPPPHAWAPYSAP